MAYAELASMLLSPRRPYVVALTGAGASADSGLPTFRGQDGLWRRYDPRELATPEAFSRDPELVWRWYSWRISMASSASPNAVHVLLARLESIGILRALMTQNVDGLHRRAGSSRVLELHGNIMTARCTSCGLEVQLAEAPQEGELPKCPSCGGLLRPSVVWFGEPIPGGVWRAAVEESRRADLMLVIGTSAEVYPASLLPSLAKEAGAVIIEVNPEPTPVTPIADLSFRVGAAEFARALAKELGIEL